MSIKCAKCKYWLANPYDEEFGFCTELRRHTHELMHCKYYLNKEVDNARHAEELRQLRQLGGQRGQARQAVL